MNTDSIKVIFTYVIAAGLILGGFIFLAIARLDPPNSPSTSMIPLVAGFIGAAVQFVFNRETQTQTARQVERSTAAGVQSQVANPTPSTGGNNP